MNSYLSWLFESGISLAAFYLAYRFFLNRESLFQSNRGFLLFALFFSVALPFLNISSPVKNLHYSYFIPEVEIIGNMATEKVVNNEAFSVFQILWYIYILVSAFLLLRFLLRLYNLQRFISQNRSLKQGKVFIIKTDMNHAPFSFFNYMVINDNNVNKNDREKIIEHESVHIRQYHSVDLLIIEILTIIQWFNPFIWLYKPALKELHEYLADREVLKKGTNLSLYQQILLNFQLKKEFFTLVNNFNYSLTKKRFIMMTKTKPALRANIKFLVLLPLLAFLLISFTKINASVFQENNPSSENPQITEIIHTPVNLNQGEPVPPMDPVKPVKVKKDEKAPPPPPPPPATASDTLKKNEKDIFIIVEEMPKFGEEDEGGSSFRKYIAENLVYPAEAIKQGMQGRVFVQFIVTSEGDIIDVEIVRGVHELLDAEAIRVIKSSPKWISGKQRGKPVNVRFTFPITFTL